MTKTEQSIVENLRIKIEVCERDEHYEYGSGCFLVVKLLYKGKEISQDEVEMYPKLYDEFKRKDR